MTNQLCICKICTCGYLKFPSFCKTLILFINFSTDLRQHKCPHRPLGILGKGGPCPVTEYKNEYQKHSATRRQPIKPDAEYRPSGIPMDGNTTNK